jgi:hypothetical protein
MSASDWLALTRFFRRLATLASLALWVSMPQKPSHFVISCKQEFQPAVIAVGHCSIFLANQHYSQSGLCMMLVKIRIAAFFL